MIPTLITKPMSLMFDNFLECVHKNSQLKITKQQNIEIVKFNLHLI